MPKVIGLSPLIYDQIKCHTDTCGSPKYSRAATASKYLFIDIQNSALMQPSCCRMLCASENYFVHLNHVALRSHFIATSTILSFESSRHVNLNAAGEDDVDVELDETMAQTLIVVDL